MTCKFIKYISIILAVSSIHTQGKNKMSAFATVKFNINYLRNCNHTIFHNYWNPGNGYEIFMEFPFYSGCIQTGLNFFSYHKKINNVPSFKTYFYNLGWGIEIPLINNLQSYHGFRIGSYQMTFNDNKIDATQVTESEFSSSIDTGLRYNIKKRIFLNITGNYLVIYTNKRIELYFISFGIAYLFKTPDWLRKFLE